MKLEIEMGSCVGFYFLLISSLSLVFASSEDVPNCLSGWKRLSNTCYKRFSYGVAWTAARSMCKTFSSRLAIIRTEEENSFIGNMTTQAKGTWIGAFRCRNKAFCWTDGSTVPVSVPRWRKGEPNNLGSSEGCVEIGPKPNYTAKWNDIPCGASRSFVCSRDVPSPTKVSQIIHINHSSVILLWNKPAHNVPQVSQYFVTYKADNDKSFKTLTVPSHVTQVHINGLKMGTKYIVRIKAANAAGNSSLGTETSFSTRRFTGSAPKIIAVNKFRILENGENKVKLVALCTVSGTAPFKFDWLLDSKVIKSASNISRNSNKLDLSDDVKKNSRQITCTVTTAEGIDSVDITILESDVEELSVMKLETFYLTLGLLLTLAAVPIIILALILCRRKQKIPHIKAASLKLKAERHKDYTYPPQVELRQVNKVQQENDCNNQAITGYYTSLKRNEDGTLMGGNSDTRELEDNQSYSNVEYPNGSQSDYPPNEVMFSTESDQQETATNSKYDYAMDELKFNIDVGCPNGETAFSEGENYSFGQEDGYLARNEGYPLEKVEYPTGNEGYIPGNEGYLPGNEGYLPGNEGYLPGNEGYLPGNEGYLPGNEGYLPGNEGYPLENNGFDDSYQGLNQSHVNSGSYERLVNSGRSNYPGDFESPIYENCMDDHHKDENKEIPIYSN